jgi:hypothetical protein
MKRALLDLDGVLVDFVGGACRLHSVANPFDDPVNHGNYRIENVLGIPPETFFLPMGTCFWAELNQTKDFGSILALVEEAFGRDNVCLLTSPIRTAGCAQGKIDWIRENMQSYWVKRQYLIGAAKHFCASHDAWLVDDSDKNVDEFRAAGGHAILVPRPWNTLHRFADRTVEYVQAALREVQ